MKLLCLLQFQMHNSEIYIANNEIEKCFGMVIVRTIFHNIFVGIFYTFH